MELKATNETCYRNAEFDQSDVNGSESDHLDQSVEEVSTPSTLRGGVGGVNM